MQIFLRPTFSLLCTGMRGDVLLGEGVEIVCADTTPGLFMGMGFVSWDGSVNLKFVPLGR